MENVTDETILPVKVRKKPGPKPGFKKRPRSTLDVLPSNYHQLDKVIIKKRRGRILIILDNLLEEENSHLLRALFSRFYPYYVKKHEGVLFGLYEYHGYCEEFAEISITDFPVTYEVELYEGTLNGFRRL